MLPLLVDFANARITASRSCIRIVSLEQKLQACAGIWEAGSASFLNLLNAVDWGGGGLGRMASTSAEASLKRQHSSEQVVASLRDQLAVASSTLLV